MKKELAYSIIDHFAIAGSIQNISSFGSGHIHDTFLVETVKNKYILQKINNHVFKHVPELMSNIIRVSNHLNYKLSSEQRKKSLKLVFTVHKKPYYIGVKNEDWRVYEFISGSSYFNLPPDTGYAYEGGKAFGEFINNLTDLPGERLNETIVNFHNVQYRLEEFNSSLAGYDRDRLIESKNEINFVHKHAASLIRIYDLYRNGLIPERITHNDTKFNNILFNREGKAICIIDLDTVMPGCIHFDFGDAVRIIANTAAEDEADTNKIVFDMEMYRAFTRGFLTPLNSILTKKEIETLALAPLYMTFIMGLRFLTDYLREDVYFKIAYPQHNWYRACAQFQLFKSMMINVQDMRQIIIDCMK
jgi:serine/threonine protein kinase